MLAATPAKEYANPKFLLHAVLILWVFDSFGRQPKLHLLVRAQFSLAAATESQTQRILVFSPRPMVLDGCPRFAPAYLGRKNGAQPLERFVYAGEGTLFRARILVCRAKALE